MQITIEFDNIHLEQLQSLEKLFKKSSSELFMAWIEENFTKNITQTEGEKVLAILQNTGYLASMPDISDLSENYKSYLDWSDKI